MVIMKEIGMETTTEIILVLIMEIEMVIIKVMKMVTSMD